MDLKKHIRDIPDFPQKGIIFKDITPLLSAPEAFQFVIASLVNRYRSRKIDKIVGIESRGFIFAAPLAHELGIGLVPARKPGKLPYKIVQESYTLEYGSGTMTMHEDAIKPGERVLIIDDLIATGGTLLATANLVDKLGGEVVEIASIIELKFLNGVKNLPGREFFSLMSY